jgi:aconitase A
MLRVSVPSSGLAPWTSIPSFVNAADYDRLEQNDRVSVIGLAALAPGKPLSLRIKKPDGRVEEIQARHTLTDEQIGWFRAGSALNAAQKH